MVSRVTIMSLSNKMQIRYLATCSYPGETVEREMQGQNEKSEKCRLKSTLVECFRRKPNYYI